MTLTDLKERMAQSFDEVTLVEMLELSSWDIIEAFSDEIEENMEKYIAELEEFEQNED